MTKYKVIWQESDGLFRVQSDLVDVKCRKISTVRRALEDILGEAVELDISPVPCPVCGQTVNQDGFKDDLSRREFEISSMCQDCQDMFFE